MPNRNKYQASGESAGSGNGGGQGGDGDFPAIPGSDKGLLAFVEYAFDLVNFWTLQARNGGFPDLSDHDKEMLQKGWEEFAGQWNDTKSRLQAAINSLNEKDMLVRGLAGPTYEYKLHVIAVAQKQLQSEYRNVQRRPEPKPPRKVRWLWRKLLELVDIVLDSISGAVDGQVVQDQETEPYPRVSRPLEFRSNP